MSTPRYRSRVGGKGQITLPLDLRQALGIRPKEYVTIEAVTTDSGAYLKVERTRPLLLELAGSVPTPPEGPLEWEDIVDRAWQAEAEYLAKEGLPGEAEDEE